MVGSFMKDKAAKGCSKKELGVLSKASSDNRKTCGNTTPLIPGSSCVVRLTRPLVSFPPLPFVTLQPVLR